MPPAMFSDLLGASKFPDFLTLPAYESIIAEGD